MKRFFHWQTVAADKMQTIEGEMLRKKMSQSVSVSTQRLVSSALHHPFACKTTQREPKTHTSHGGYPEQMSTTCKVQSVSLHFTEAEESWMSCWTVFMD